MARIIGGIGTSHVPTIAMAFDRGKQEEDDDRLRAPQEGAPDECRGGRRETKH